MLNNDFRDILSAFNAASGRMIYRVDDLSVPFLSKSHLVANKRATGRPQDLADVERLLAVRP